MTKPKFVRDVPRVNPLCRLCGHALSSAKHVICEWCLGRCMNCGAPADPSTAGQSERVGRLCIPCSDVDPTGAITLWAAAFGQLRRGHIRRHPTAGRIWVNSCVVNPGAIGSVNKDYAIERPK